MDFGIPGMVFIFLAAVLWGVTNPLLKLFTVGFADEKKDQSGGVLSDVLFLLRRPKYVLAQAVNFGGTACFFLGLRTVEVSVGSVVANALALAITCAVSVLVLKEEPLSLRSTAGVFCVVGGVSLCAYSRSLS